MKVLIVCVGFVLLGLIASSEEATAYNNRQSIHYGRNNNNGSNRKPGMCPFPKSLAGNCTVDPSINCANDAACTGTKKCCRERCNRVCKDVIKSTEDMTLPDFGFVAKWRSEKMKEWNTWAEESRKMLMYVNLISKCTEIIRARKCWNIVEKVLNIEMEKYQRQHNILPTNKGKNCGPLGHCNPIQQINSNLTTNINTTTSTTTLSPKS